MAASKQTLLAALLAVVALCGCTAQELYEWGREHQEEKCRSGPPSDYDECMRRADQSYEAYQRNKQEVEENP